jgi:hypothetical protein
MPQCDTCQRTYHWNCFSDWPECLLTYCKARCGK